MNTNIATLANQMNKPNKMEAQRMLRDVFAEIEGAEHKEMLAQLYTYFMPAMPKKAKTDWQWVAQAIAKKEDPRVYLQYVYVTGDRIVATDGYRLHIAPNNDGLAPGYYLSNGAWVEPPEFAKYPDVDRVIPKEGTTANVDMAGLSLTEITSKITAYVISTEQGEIAVQKRHLDAAVNGAQQFTMLHGDKTQAIRIDQGNRLAVVMPTRR